MASNSPAEVQSSKRSHADLEDVESQGTVSKIYRYSQC